MLNKSRFLLPKSFTWDFWKLREISANPNRLQESRVPSQPINGWTKIYKQVTLDQQMEQSLCSVWEVRVVPCWPACMVCVIAAPLFVNICRGVVQCLSDGHL